MGFIKSLITIVAIVGLTWLWAKWLYQGAKKLLPIIKKKISQLKAKQQNSNQTENTNEQNEQ